MVYLDEEPRQIEGTVRWEWGILYNINKESSCFFQERYTYAFYVLLVGRFRSKDW